MKGLLKIVGSITVATLKIVGALIVATSIIWLPNLLAYLTGDTF
jgi:ABC-type Mn2+/Zn2+ transport system permease subunit